MAFGAGGERPIDGGTAAGWKAEPDWSPGKAAARHGVANREGWLEFTASGGIMTWTFEPSAEHVGGGKRYLLFRYRGEGIAPTGEYLLLAEDGSPGWRHYLTQRHLRPDGEEHAIAIDLLGLLPPDNISRLALRIGPAPEVGGRLSVRMSMADEIPNGADVVGSTPPERKAVRVEAESLDWKESPSWVPRNAAKSFVAERSAAGVVFRASGEGLSMRWPAAKVAVTDVARMPFFAVRYRAKGEFAAGGYVLQGYVADAKGKRQSAHLMSPRDIDADGRWHVYRGVLEDRGSLESLAAGVDCGAAAAEIEVDWIGFQSEPFRLPVAELLDFVVRPEGGDDGGLVPLPPPARGADGLGPVALARFGIGDWFPSRHIAVDGIPFDVPPRLDGVAATGIVEEDSVGLEVPGGTGAREVLLLLAATFPQREEFAHWRTQSPLRLLSEPERMVIELDYGDGQPEQLLPIHAAKRVFGIGHGLAVYGVPLADGRVPRRLILRDRMRNAGFAIVGATLNRGERRVADPDVPPLAYPVGRKAPIADAAFRFQCERGLAWGDIESPLFGRGIALRGEPVFSMRVGGRDIPSTSWTIQKTSRGGDGGFTAACAWEEGGVSLRADFEAKAIDSRSRLLTLAVRNAGAEPVTGTLFFPTLSGLALGSAGETWYLSGRTGCVINRLPCAWRDEIGEPHALQLDGFFNPAMGAGIALMSRDPEGVFRWYRLGKDARGGSYGLEFLPQTVCRGGAWECVPVAIAAVPGDWREQVALYKESLRSWYRPAAPRKPWFARVFGFPSYSPTEPFTRILDERVDLVRQVRKIEGALGTRDYLHLFGWAITEEHGHWGAYDEYRQLGGLPRFVDEIRKCREAGVPVGLYLDGYLVATRATKPLREQRERWAVRTAEGKMLYHENYDAHSMCPYAAGWREHLVGAYRRVAEEVKPDGMYIDEFGKSMVGRICHAKDHGHPSPAGMSPGEGILAREVRAAVPPEIALYCEYVPSDVMCQHLDGAFGHTALHGHADGYDKFSPHYLNLQRFTQPDFKVFELIYYAPLKNGNWSLLKYPFFNGEGYYMTGTYAAADDNARGFLRKALRLLREHADAFTSTDVEPLVPTLAPGLFANRFSGPGETVWTIFNSNYRTLRGPLLVVPHRQGASYRDAWADRPIGAPVRDGAATLTLDIGPRQVGCIVAN